MRKTIMILCFLLLFTACGNEMETPSEVTSEACFMALEDVLRRIDIFLSASEVHDRHDIRVKMIEDYEEKLNKLKKLR